MLANEDRITSVDCVLTTAEKDRARATVRAVRVPDDWLTAHDWEIPKVIGFKWT